MLRLFRLLLIDLFRLCPPFLLYYRSLLEGLERQYLLWVLLDLWGQEDLLCHLYLQCVANKVHWGYHY